MTKQQIIEEAMKFPPNERFEFAEALLESVEDFDDLTLGIAPGQAAELDRISKHADEHPETLIPHTEVMRRAREILRGKLD